MSLVEVKVNGLILEHKTQQNIVVLREAEGERLLPIWIGPVEAQAIRRLLSGEAFPRPLTHDLIQILLDGMKAKVSRVVIARLEDNTFFADIIVTGEGGILSVDARPSDSIAIALRAGAPVFVNEDLLQPPLDRPHKKPGGYLMRDKLAAPRQASGEANPKALSSRTRRPG